MASERSTIYTDSGRLGFVYCLTSKHMPNLVKIGACRKHPLQRADELSAGTGVPGPFTISYYRDFQDAFLAESLVHECFAYARVNNLREFFSAPLDEVIDFINALPTSVDYQEQLASKGVTGGEYQKGSGIVATPFADLYATFDSEGPPELSVDEQAQCRELEAQGRDQGIML